MAPIAVVAGTAAAEDRRYTTLAGNVPDQLPGTPAD
jgi:hypothetical protein